MKNKELDKEENIKIEYMKIEYMQRIWTKFPSIVELNKEGRNGWELVYLREGDNNVYIGIFIKKYL